MKKLVLLISFLFVTGFIYADEALPVDEDVKAGTVSEKEVAPTEEEKEVTEEAEELDTKEADEKETSPAMPEEAEKSVYFGDVRFIAQYTSLSMNDFNKAAGSNIKNIHNGLDLGVALGIKINSYLSPFLRIDFITSLTENGNFDYIMYLNAMPVDLGIEYSIYFPESPYRLAFSAAAGATFAYGKFDSIDHIVNPFNAVRSFGMGFNAMADISLQYQINSAVSAGITAGYRYMPVSKMVQLDGPEKNNAYKNTDNKDLVFDFSGLTAGLSIGMNY